MNTDPTAILGAAPPPGQYQPDAAPHTDEQKADAVRAQLRVMGRTCSECYWWPVHIPGNPCPELSLPVGESALVLGSPACHLFKPGESFVGP